MHRITFRALPIASLLSQRLHCPLRRARATTTSQAQATMTPNELPEVVEFGPVKIPRAQVFAATVHSFAFVNLKPLVPGHVLISPRRVVARFGDLSAAEVADLWQLAQKVSRCLEVHFKADSMSLVIQDGPAAGQTIAHVHVHCLPRVFEDFEHNDQVYDAIDEAEKEEASARLHKRLDLDQQRVVRTPEEMSKESQAFREAMDTFA